MRAAPATACMPPALHSRVVTARHVPVHARPSCERARAAARPPTAHRRHMHQEHAADADHPRLPPPSSRPSPTPPHSIGLCFGARAICPQHMTDTSERTSSTICDAASMQRSQCSDAVRHDLWDRWRILTARQSDRAPQWHLRRMGSRWTPVPLLGQPTLEVAANAASLDKPLELSRSNRPRPEVRATPGPTPKGSVMLPPSLSRTHSPQRGSQHNGQLRGSRAVPAPTDAK